MKTVHLGTSDDAMHTAILWAMHTAILWARHTEPTTSEKAPIMNEAQYTFSESRMRLLGRGLLPRSGTL